MSDAKYMIWALAPEKGSDFFYPKHTAVPPLPFTLFPLSSTLSPLPPPLPLSSPFPKRQFLFEVSSSNRRYYVLFSVALLSHMCLSGGLRLFLNLLPVRGKLRWRRSDSRGHVGSGPLRCEPLKHSPRHCPRHPRWLRRHRLGSHSVSFLLLPDLPLVSHCLSMLPYLCCCGGVETRVLCSTCRLLRPLLSYFFHLTASFPA